MTTKRRRGDPKEKGLTIKSTRFLVHKLITAMLHYRLSPTTPFLAANIHVVTGPIYESIFGCATPPWDMNMRRGHRGVGVSVWLGAGGI